MPSKQGETKSNVLKVFMWMESRIETKKKSKWLKITFGNKSYKIYRAP